MAKVLVVDDDPALLRALRLGLGALGHEVTTALRGEAGLAQVAITDPDVVVLDLGLPDVDGLEVARRLRQWSQVPVIVLSARDSDARKVRALDEGADDYVVKPFSMTELEARLRAALRRRQHPSEETPALLEIGPLVLDLVRHSAVLRDKGLALTPKEFDLLVFLARHHDKVCTHQMILNAVWGMGYSGEVQYLHAYIRRLRHNLGGDSGVRITTAPGIGYVLALETVGADG